MFCSTCGNTVVAGLRFCNKCGAKTGLAQDNDPGRFPQSTINLLIAAMLGLPIVGVGLLIGMMAVAKKLLNFADEWVVIMTMLCIVLFLATEAGLLWLLFSRTGRKSEEREDRVESPSLNTAPTRALGEARPDAVDITENATRTFEPAYREPKE